MSVLGQVWGIVFMIVGLLVSVGCHEAGHMLFAKRFGVPVPEFAIGFGPRVFSFTARGTRYSLRAIPLGGFVSIPGMFPPAREGAPVLTRKGKLTLAEEARIQSAREMPGGTTGRPFYTLAARQKVLVMLAGPVTNLLLAVVLTAVALIGIGITVPSTTVEKVVETLPSASGEVPSPASTAGMRAGDRIVSIDSRNVTSWDDVVTGLGSSAGRECRVVVERDGQRIELVMTPIEGPSGRGLAGVVAQHETRPAQVSEVAGVVWGMGAGTAAVVVRLPMALWDVAVSLVTDQPRDAQGVVSVVGVGRLAGEVSQEATQRGGEAFLQSVQLLLLLLASLNMALFVFNLLPLPPLDGGHIAGALYEGARKVVARIRKRPDPGPADTAKLVPVSYTVGAILVGMSVLLIVADIIKPVTLG